METEVRDREAILKLIGWSFNPARQGGWFAIHENDPSKWVYYVYPTKTEAITTQWEVFMAGVENG